MVKWLLKQLFALSLIIGIHGSMATAMPIQPSEFSENLVGSIIIKTSERKLIYVEDWGHILTFSIAVGKAGRKWSGTTTVSRKVLNPAWAPPPLVRLSNPDLPALVKPGPNNPLGAAVLVLGDGTYGIHGTNRDETIGTDASFGCFRMHNSDILSLIKRVKIGTVVYVQQ